MFHKGIGGDKPADCEFIINPHTLRLKDRSLISARSCTILFQRKVTLKLGFQEFFPINKSPLGTLVFIHGNSSSSRVFNNQLNYYKENYHVLGIDLLGHGNSTLICDFEHLTSQEKEYLSEDFYNPLCFIAQLIQLLEARNIKNAHVIGWSLGGNLGYGLAAESDLVSSLITIAAPPVRFSTSGFKKGFSNWFIQTVADWISNPKRYSDDQAMNMIKSMGFTEADQFVAQDMIKTDPYVRKWLFANLHEYDNTRFDASGIDAEYFVTHTKIPLFLFVGSDDIGIIPDSIRAVMPKFHDKNSRAEVIDGAKHSVFNNPKIDLNRLIDHFLNSFMGIEKESGSPAPLN